MLGRQAIHAIKALLELAAEPQQWRSVNDLAAAQDLPAPMLEQLLLKLRRAQLLEARRGRLGGYRLARPAAAIPLAEVLTGLDHGLGFGAANIRESDTAALAVAASDRVTDLLERRLHQALERELARCSLAELLYDLRSASAELSEGGGLLLG